MSKTDLITIISSTWAMALAGAIAALGALRLVALKESYDFEHAWTRDEMEQFTYKAWQREVGATREGR